MRKALLVVTWSSIALADPLRVPGDDPIITITKTHVEVSQVLTFDGDALTAAGGKIADAIAAALATDPTLKVEIRGDHASVVRDALIARGVTGERLVAKGGKGKLEFAVAGHIKLPDVRPPVAADLATYTKDIKGDGPLVATIATNHGTIHCQLLEADAPMTVANFVGLATGQKPWTDPSSKKTVKGKPYFDGLTFHRVIPSFMIQGGDPTGTGSGFPGYTFGLETQAHLTWEPGTLAMANAGPNTNGSQFFITEIAPDNLKDGYTIFGRCTDPDVVKEIARVPRNKSDRPDTAVTMDKVTIARGTK